MFFVTRATEICGGARRKGAPTFNEYFHEYIVGAVSKKVSGVCTKKTKVAPVRQQTCASQAYRHHYLDGALCYNPLLPQSRCLERARGPELYVSVALRDVTRDRKTSLFHTGFWRNLGHAHVRHSDESNLARGALFFAHTTRLR